MSAHRTAKATVTICLVAGLLTACRDTTLVPPRSLDSPSAMAVARGKVCLATGEDAERVVRYAIFPCEDGEIGAIGLVTNEQSDRLALMDLNAPLPRLVDLDPTTPGPNHLEVGRLPVDVAASPDGSVAYTLNQLDRDISIVDLFAPRVLDARFRVDETPIAMDVDPSSGEVIVAAGSPTRLYGFAGISYCDADQPCDDSPDPSEVEPRTLDLPGTVSGMVVDPRGGDVWVVYRDLGYASVVSFGDTPDGFDTACLSGQDDKPCLVAHVSLGAECSDGLDNDGDGLVDQQDIQCFGPTGAESATGIGRIPMDACANGLDDDEDGLVDRDDPECALASGVDEAVAPVLDAAVCGDGTDNDGDGTLDYPNDAQCYGVGGRTEATIRTVGFDAVGIDSHGVFVYVADRANEQVLVIDAGRKQLIDGPASEIPSTQALDPGLGVDMSPSPLNVQGAIDRDVLWIDPADDEHAVIRYDFGAWVSANNGSIQYIDTAVTFCEVRGEIVPRDEFWRGLQSDAETDCLTVPAFPLQSAVDRVLAADPSLPASCLDADFVACAECLATGELACAPCENYADTQFELCQRGFLADEGPTRYVNPRFALRDGGGDDGRLLGDGTCNQPDELVVAMQLYAEENPTGPQDLKCTSLLMPQPRDIDTITAAVTDINDFGRAELFQLRTLQYEIQDDAAEPLVGFRPSDQRILNEGINVTFEGIIPGTQRTDGLMAEAAEDDGSIWVDVGFNPCDRGVEVGDHFLITSETLGSCDVALQSEALEYEVVERDGSQLRIAPFEGGEQVVPVRDCFEEGFAYEVRAIDQWVVAGETSGFLSPYQSVRGACVPRFGADQLTSRVRTAEIYEGPYYRFYLHPGVTVDNEDPDASDPILPLRDLSFTFQTSSGFQPVLFPTCSSVGQQCAAGLFPAQVLWVPGLPGGSLLLSPDPNDEFIHVRNLDDGAGGYTVVR